jgi:hypothetical protein
MGDSNQPFNWKQFFFGIGVPLLFMGSGLILSSIATLMNPDRDTPPQDITLVRGEDDTYTGVFVLDDETFLRDCIIDEIPVDYYRVHCNSWIGTNSDKWATPSEQESVRISGLLDYNEGVVQLGSWNRSTGIITCSSSCGDDRSEIVFTLETEYDRWNQNDVAKALATLSGFVCCLTPLAGIAMIAIGFSSNRKAMGIGGVVAFVSYLIWYVFFAVSSLLADLGRGI